MSTDLWLEILPLALYAFAQGALWASLTISLYFLISLGWFKSKRTDGRDVQRWTPLLHTGSRYTHERW